MEETLSGSLMICWLFFEPKHTQIYNKIDIREQSLRVVLLCLLICFIFPPRKRLSLKVRQGTSLSSKGTLIFRITKPKVHKIRKVRGFEGRRAHIQIFPCLTFTYPQPSAYTNFLIPCNLKVTLKPMVYT